MAQLVSDSGPVGGITFVTVNGVALRAVSDVHYNPGVQKREDAGGQDGIHGFTEQVKTAVIKGRFRDGSGLTVSAINTWAGVPAVVELNNGKVVSGNNGWTHEVGEVDTAEGVFDIEWHFASPLNEQLVT